MLSNHRTTSRHKSAVRLLLVALSLLLPLAAQKKADDEIQKLKKEDPYTKNDPEVMKALGVVRYGPFPWADHLRTTDVDKVLGEGRILWMETRHFCIGYNMSTAPLPQDNRQKKAVYAECRAIHKLCRRFPAKPKRLGPWVRLHLFAQRCEHAYAEFERLVGVTDKSFEKGAKTVGKGEFLGLPGKFLMLLFQKKSDMARYMKRFCNTEADDSMRYYHRETGQMLVCVSAEGMEGFDEPGIHGHVLYALWQNLLNGYRGYNFPLPLWLSCGVAHYYSRQVESDYINANIKDTESVDQQSQNKWYEKVFKRARHDGATIPFAELAGITDPDAFGFHAHTQAWSRVQFLMETDRQKVGLMIDKLKRVPPAGDWESQGKQIARMAQKLVFDLFGMDGPTFDATWRKWVLKNYPKRK